MSSQQHLRRCAAALMELAPDDQRWLLARLPAAHRATLAQLQAQCTEWMGPGAAAPLARAQAEPTLAAVAAQDPQGLAQWLAQQPLRLGAAALRQLPVRVCETVLNTLALPARKALMRQLEQDAQAPIAPAFEQAVRHAFAQAHLAQPAPTARRPQARRGWRAWMHRAREAWV